MVLDASALLAVLLAEPGAGAVQEAIHEGAAMSTVNWAEALSWFSSRGHDPQAVADEVLGGIAADDAIGIHALESDDAVLIARLRPLTRHLGLSLADRACLALAIALDRPVLTADRAWAELRIGVEVRLIRD